MFYCFIFYRRFSSHLPASWTRMAFAETVHPPPPAREKGKPLAEKRRSYPRGSLHSGIAKALVLRRVLCRPGLVCHRDISRACSASRPPPISLVTRAAAVPFVLKHVLLRGSICRFLLALLRWGCEKAGVRKAMFHASSWCLHMSTTRWSTVRGWAAEKL